MSGLFKLHDGVPLPKIEKNQPPRKWPVKSMRVGQFLLLPEREVKQVSAYVSRITKDLPGKFSVRQAFMTKKSKDTPDDWAICEEGDDGATKGVGVWRTE